MAASYPSSIKIFSSKTSGSTIRASHVNELQDEVAAIETALKTGLGHNLLFSPDATYDIGASGATRPRDLFCSRNAAFGGTLDVTGASNLAALTLSGLLTLTGGQAKFPSTQAASADANTLDDYEEGTFTPALQFGGAAVGMTGTQTGVYVKVGQIVFFALRITLTAKGSSTGAAKITGLPFTSHGTVYGGCHPAYFLNLGTSVGSIYCYISTGATAIDLTALPSASVVAGTATGVTNMTDAYFTNTTDIIITGCYRANA